jgi:hypothetical protein
MRPGGRLQRRLSQAKASDMTGPSVWTRELVWAEVVSAAAVSLNISVFEGEPTPDNTLESATPSDIPRILEVRRWMSVVPAIQRDVLWARATKQRWKQICWQHGVSRPTAHRQLQRALNTILANLTDQQAHRGHRASS